MEKQTEKSYGELGTQLMQTLDRHHMITQNRKEAIKQQKWDKGMQRTIRKRYWNEALGKYTPTQERHRCNRGRAEKGTRRKSNDMKNRKRTTYHVAT